MLKKIFSLLLMTILLLNIGIVSAESNSYSDSGANTLFDDKGLEFKAKLQDGVVHMSWYRFDNDNKVDSSDYFKYYKIVRSTTNSNPVYPDDGHIKYFENIDKKEHIDYSPKKGVSYYRICAITKAEKRYCSNVVKIYVEQEQKDCTDEYAPVCGYTDGSYKTYSNKCKLLNDDAYYKYSGKCKTETDYTVCTDDYSPVCGYTNGAYKTYSNKCKLLNAKSHYKYSGECKNIKTVTVEKTTNTYGLSNVLQIKSKGIINRFIKKIESKGYSSEKNIEVIDNIIVKLNSLEDKKPQLSNLLNYLIDLLNEKKEKYQNDFSDIEDIFDID